ncbi:MAG: N-methyl-L-tryptophan oxidase [Planctomycetales bacterium]|nr:N-methyl-L-tryptophan oxidase [Planctomycetales bacterium]
MEHYDVAVIGVGGVGSATLRTLALAGFSAVGIEQFEIAHANGSSHGETRIIRQAYFEHPDYVPLLKLAYELWEKIEAHSNRTLWLRNGLLEIGPPDGILIQGIESSVQTHDLPVRRLTADECRKTYPQYHVPEDFVAIFEENAGVLLVEECVKSMAEQATQAGATLFANEPIQKIDFGNTHVLHTANQTIAAKQVVVTAGGWASNWIAPLRRHLQLRRKRLEWYSATSSRSQADARCPAFFYELPQGYFYGFPAIIQQVKVAEHSGGKVLPNPEAQNDDHAAYDEECRRRVDTFAREYLLDAQEWRKSQSCIYTVSPDEHFIVDRHPEFENVLFAAGLSGHGFKFAPALGQILCDMTQGKKTSIADFLRLQRLT